MRNRIVRAFLLEEQKIVKQVLKNKDAAETETTTAAPKAEKSGAAASQKKK